MPHDTTALAPNETALRGGWIASGAARRDDAVTSRIRVLTTSVLVKVATDPSGWETLYKDPSDGRLWEETYPQSELHGGGPPTLQVIAKAAAATKYGL